MILTVMGLSCLYTYQPLRFRPGAELELKKQETGISARDSTVMMRFKMIYIQERWAYYWESLWQFKIAMEE